MPYKILFLPLIAGLLAQAIKFFIKSNQKKASMANLFAYSGMPSAHSAIVICLALIIGLEEGWHSALFAISVILAIIVIRDAIGIRRYLGQHGRVLNILVKDLDEDYLLDKTYPHLLEHIGHTPAQVIVGSLLGAIVALVGYYFL